MWWTTRDGRLIPIDQLHTDHIRNCIARIKCSVARGKPWRTAYLETLVLELDRREDLNCRLEPKVVPEWPKMVRWEAMHDERVKSRLRVDALLSLLGRD